MTRAPSEDEIRRIYGDTIEGLYGFISRRCNGERELAEDVTQETWLRAVRAWRADGVPDKPLAWLSTVAARLLSNHYRRPAMRAFEDGVGNEVAAPDPDIARAGDERRSLLQRALDRLPQAQTRLLEAFHYDRRPIADIAADSGLSPRAVEGRLRRARQSLRRELETDPDLDGDNT